MTRQSNFAQFLRHYRLENGITQPALAKAAGVSPSYITLLEAGKRRNPSRQVAVRLADSLNLGQGERIAFLAAAHYLPERELVAPSTPEPPLLAAFRRFLSSPEGSPEAADEIRRVLKELLATASQKGVPQVKKEMQGIGLLIRGYFHRQDDAVGEKRNRQRLSQRQIDRLGAKLLTLSKILADGTIPVERRLRIADELISFARWKSQTGGRTGQAAREIPPASKVTNRERSNPEDK